MFSAKNVVSKMLMYLKNCYILFISKSNSIFCNFKSKSNIKKTVINLLDKKCCKKSDNLAYKSLFYKAKAYTAI